MQMMIFVLNRIELLEGLLAELGHHGIKGATVFNTTGMAHVLTNDDEMSFLGSLRNFLEPNREDNRTIMMALDDEQVLVARNVIVSIVGDLTKPNTGILFTVPIGYSEGVMHADKKGSD